jgi:hypothetical protein
MYQNLWNIEAAFNKMRRLQLQQRLQLEQQHRRRTIPFWEEEEEEEDDDADNDDGEEERKRRKKKRMVGLASLSLSHMMRNIFMNSHCQAIFKIHSKTLIIPRAILMA